MESRIGPYELGDSLGPTPFGELVAAKHPARSESLAVLVLDDRLASDHRFRGLLRLEVARAGGVRHPALARTVEVGEHSGKPYVVVERPGDARTLAQAFADDDAPSGERAVELIRRLAEGLDAAHGRRLVHGAVEPATVLVGSDGVSILVGMALIGAVDEAGLRAIVEERSDAPFRAPEMGDGGRTPASADGYALGALAARLLRIQTAPVTRADALGAVLARQGSADPAARYSTCTAFASALADAVSTVDAPDPIRPEAGATSAPTPGVGAAIQPPSLTPPPSSTPTANTLSLPLPASRTSPPTPSDTLAPADPQPAPTEPSAPGDTGRHGEPLCIPDAATPPAESPPSPRDTTRPAQEPPSDARRDWLSTVIDPPRSAPTTRPHVGALHANPPSYETELEEVNVTTADLTPSMAEVLKPMPPRDVFGDAIRLVADRVPAIR
jgi:serine/threonine-protein kinase